MAICTFLFFGLVGSLAALGDSQEPVVPAKAILKIDFSLLASVGRGKIYGMTKIGESDARVFAGGAYALLRFFDGGVGKSDNVKGEFFLT